MKGLSETRIKRERAVNIKEEGRRKGERRIVRLKLRLVRVEGCADEGSMREFAGRVGRTGWKLGSGGLRRDESWEGKKKVSSEF